MLLLIFVRSCSYLYSFGALRLTNRPTFQLCGLLISLRFSPFCTSYFFLRMVLGYVLLLPSDGIWIRPTSSFGWYLWGTFLKQPQTRTIIYLNFITTLKQLLFIITVGPFVLLQNLVFNRSFLQHVNSFHKASMPPNSSLFCLDLGSLGRHWCSAPPFEIFLEKYVYAFSL